VENARLERNDYEYYLGSHRRDESETRALIRLNSQPTAREERRGNGALASDIWINYYYGSK
jgi:hypothetical protein